MSGSGKGPKRVAGRARTQRRIAAAPDQLLRLRVQLDLANAAAASLDVIARDLDLAAAGLGGDLPLDRLDILNGCNIEILAPDEGPQPLHHVDAHRPIAGDRTRLDHRGALPVLPVALVVLFRSRGGNRERCGAHIGPEIQIGWINAAFADPFRKERGEVANETVQRLHGLAPSPVMQTFRIEEYEQVERA